MNCQGDYKFDCLLDRQFFSFTAIEADNLEAVVATGADDDAVAVWIERQAKTKS